MFLNLPHMVTSTLAESVIKIIEFISTALDIVPHNILRVMPVTLSSLCDLDDEKDCNRQHVYLTIKIVEVVRAMCAYKATYKEVIYVIIFLYYELYIFTFVIISSMYMWQ